MKERVSGATELTKEQADAILAELDAGIAKLTAAAEKAKAATTKEEVKAAAKEVESVWKAYKHRVELHAARLLHAKGGEIIQRSSHLEARLQKALAALGSKGVKVEGLDAKISEFSAKIKDARDHYKLGEEMFAKAKESGDDAADKAIVQEARKHVKLAQEALQEVHKLLKEIVKAIKDAGGEVEEESAAEVEVVVDAEDPSTDTGDVAAVEVTEQQLVAEEQGAVEAEESVEEVETAETNTEIAATTEPTANTEPTASTETSASATTQTSATTDASTATDASTTAAAST